MRSKRINIISLLIAFLLGGLLTYGILNSFNSNVAYSNIGVSSNTSSVGASSDKTGISASVAKIYDSVVMVENYQNDALYGTGTGFVYKKDNKYGYLLTNYHVISGAKTIKVVLSNEEIVEATYVGGDQYLDLAVIKISASKVLNVATIGSSENSKIGDTVFTVGSPEGSTYRGSVTSGILSGKDRIVSVAVDSSNVEDYAMKVLQTDAAVNPGNSGGPLVNINGEVIGIISMKIVDDEIEGMGFAIPIEDVMSHINDLESGKAIERPMIGISLINAKDKVSAYRYGLSIDENVTEGVIVAGIEKGSGASNSDLKTGDIITKINGENTIDIAHLRYELFKHKVGDTIEITYIRNGKTNTTKVKLTKSTN
ncbi:MAG: S1C family serine protease [Bacilli bacterium]